MTRDRRPMPGQMVILTHVPLSLLRESAEEKEEIIEASARPMFLVGYRRVDGRAELEFEDTHGVLHAIRVDAICIEPAPRPSRSRVDPPRRT